MKQLYITLTMLVFCLVAPLSASANGAQIVLDTGWEYRWGDSPFDANATPLWTRGDAPDQWHAIGFPSNPPGRDGQRNVWYRTTLPEGTWRDPVIYIYSVDLITEVYLDGNRIYNYGTFDENGQGRFEGWPWHMISLPPDFQGKPVYFRVFSSYSDIGLWGEVMLMERLDLIQRIFTSSMEKIVVSGLSLLIAFLALLFAAVQSERRTYILISLFTLSSSVMLFAQSQVKQFLLNAPLVWDHLAATSYFLLPIFMALLFATWCRQRCQKFLKFIWMFHSLFVVIAIGGSLAGIFELSDMYLVFDGLLTISLAVLFVIAFSQFKQVDGTLKVVITTFAIFSVFLLIDMGVAHNLLPWTRLPIAWGLLIFSMAMIALSLRHFAQTHLAMQVLNATLEQKVEERTLDLERLASHDPLTDLLNRRAFYEEGGRLVQSAQRYGRKVAVLMLDLDHFKDFNDTFGHSVGDEILVQFAKCLRQICRETDIAARFGGEEFIVLLEEAGMDDALKTAERLREAIKQIEIPGTERRITTSIGVAEFYAEHDNLEAVIGRADKALYTAKDEGRDNCQVG